MYLALERVQIQWLAVVLLPSMPHSRQIVTQENTLLWLLVLLANTQEKCIWA